jgi:hypothetical protein
LESRVTRSVVVRKFPRHPGNDARVVVISFLETIRNNKGLNRATNQGGAGGSIMLLAAETCSTDTAVCASALLVHQAVLVPPS